MAFSSLIDLLEKQSQHFSDDRTLLFYADGETSNDCRTFSDLASRAKKIGSFLLAHHQPGDVILLPFAPALEFVDAFFGVIYAGMIAVPSPATRIKRTDSRSDAIMEDAQPVCILQATSMQADKIREHYDSQQVSVYSIESILGQDVVLKEPVFNAVAYLQYTSGSISNPKGVEITHENVLDNCALIGRSIGLNSEDTLVSWLPHFHDMGLVGGIIIPIFHAMTLHLMPPVTFIQKPQRWLNLISKVKASVSVAPNFAYELCERKISDDEIKDLDLSNWRTALNGSEPIMASSVKNFIARFEKYGFKRKAICGCYGMAESTLGVTMQAPENEPFFAFDKESLREGRLTYIANEELVPPDDIEVLVACGSIDPQIDVRIINPDNLRVCDEGHIGEIWVHGKGVAKAYWRNQQASSATFGGRIDGDGQKTYLRTGDYGGIVQNELFITGRIKDMIIVRGRNFFPQDIELCATQCHPILKPHRSAVFESNKKDLIVVQEVFSSEASNTYSELAQIIKDNIFDEFELDISEVLFVKHKSIPLTTSGKLQREKCRIMYSNNAFIYLAREYPTKSLTRTRSIPDTHIPRQFFSPRDAIEFSLVEIVAEVLGIHNLSIFDNLMDYGIESVRIVELVEALNAKFNKSFSLSLLIENPSLEKIAVAIRNETTNKPSSPFVVLKKGTSDKFLFCIHTIGGNPYIYYELSQKVSAEYNIVGIQAKGLEEGEEPYHTIEDMAKSYIEKIIEFSPKEEIYILGYSSAAIIAFEVAQKIQRQYRRKTFLCFVDPLSPNDIRDMRSVGDVEMQFRATLGDGLIKSEKDWKEYWEKNSDEITEIKTDEERIAFLEKQLTLAPSTFFPEFGEKRLRRFLSTFMSIYKALWQYVPHTVFRGKIHLIRTKSKGLLQLNSLEDESLGWHGNATEGVVIKNIEGEHLAVLTEPAVSNVSKILNSWISLKAPL